MLRELILTKSFPAAIRRVREHRALGHRTVLITGALDFVVEPLRPLFDDIVCAVDVDRRRRHATPARCTDVPPTGESRARRCSTTPRPNDLDLAESVAYADSRSDLPMLEVVGFPVAVNPETRLAALARKRGWLVEHWAKAARRRRRPLPAAGHAGLRSRRARGASDEGAACSTASRPAYAAAAVAGRVVPGAGRPVGPLRAGATSTRPSCPADGWVRLRPRLAGICGSDLATIDGRSSRYFEPIVSFPFTPGHEVVGDLDDGTPGRARPRALVRDARHRPALPGLRRRPDQPLRAHRVRPPRARPADGLLRRHRRRLVDRDGRPREPAARRARRR